MEKVSTWIIAGFLAYICLMLTTISGKLDNINSAGMQIAMMEEVKPESFQPAVLRTALYQQSTPEGSESVHPWMIIAGLMATFISWHLARVYYTHQWTHRLLRKTYAHYNHPSIQPKSRELLHPDQDCVGDPPRVDGRIKDSWLPNHAHSFRTSCLISRDC